MLLLLGGFLILMLLGVPVAIAMAASSLLYILVSGVTPDVTLAQRMIAGVAGVRPAWKATTPATVRRFG